MMNARCALAAGCLSALLSAGAAASDLSYTFLDFQYIRQEVLASGVQLTAGAIQTVSVDLHDGDGVAVNGSLAIGDRFYASGAYQSAIVDVSGVVANPLGTTAVEDTFDLVGTRLAFGYLHELGDNFDLFAEVSYDTMDYDFGSFAGENFDTGDKAAGGRLGFRWNPTPPLELSVSARHAPLGKVDLTRLELEPETVYKLAVRWYFLEDLGLGFDFEDGAVETLTVTMRFSFGNLPW